MKPKEPQKPIRKPQKTVVARTPLRQTLEIIGIYVAFGILWIFFSDRTLVWLIGDPQTVERIQTVKGIFYVLVTGYLFYLIIKRRMDLYYQSIQDLTVLEKKLYQLAYFDPLTGLLSRNKLIERIDEIVAEKPDDPFAFVLVDIDDFKNINESKGHDIGDMLIGMVADEIRKITEDPDETARIGGDEFVILLRGVPDKQRLLEVIQDNAAQIRKSFLLDGEEFFVTFSAGIALFPDHGRDFQSLIRNADLALVTAKQRGKSQIVLFDSALEKRVLRQIEITNLLHSAIPNGEIEVFYQPIMSMHLDRITSVEALIRWHHPTQGFIPPLDFIPIAEMSEMIHDLTWFVIERCFRQRSAWEEIGIHLDISINLSTKVLVSPDFLPRLSQLLTETGADPHRFAFEITESVLVDSPESTVGLLKKIKQLGFRLDLDDFGSGYSSLTYLYALPIDVVKLDRGFIKNLDRKGKGLKMMESIIRLAHGMDMLVVSEGVEDTEQLSLVKAWGSDFVQGFLFAKPMPGDQIPDFLEKNDLQLSF